MSKCIKLYIYISAVIVYGLYFHKAIKKGISASEFLGAFKKCLLFSIKLIQDHQRNSEIHKCREKKVNHTFLFLFLFFFLFFFFFGEGSLLPKPKSYAWGFCPSTSGPGCSVLLSGESPGGLHLASVHLLPSRPSQSERETQNLNLKPASQVILIQAGNSLLAEKC